MGIVTCQRSSLHLLCSRCEFCTIAPQESDVKSMLILLALSVRTWPSCQAFWPDTVSSHVVQDLWLRIRMSLLFRRWEIAVAASCDVKWPSASSGNVES